MRKRLEWWWRVWRARHWEWVAYMDWYHGKGNWDTYQLVQKQRKQIQTYH